MMLKIVTALVVLYLVLVLQPLSAQNSDTNDVASLAEELFARQDGDVTYDELYDQLLMRFTDPLDLNAATPEDIRSLHLLSENQISELMECRRRTGPFNSTLELQGLTTFDIPFLKKILPFICISSGGESGWKNLFQRIRNAEGAYLIYRSDGNLINRFPSSVNSSADVVLPGSQWSGSYRFRVSHRRDFSIGWNAEKDRGERFLWNPRDKWFGFDFHSFHIQFQEKPVFKNLIIGDYSASFGQGLVLGGGFGVGKGSETITTIRRAGSGFRPYSSLSESGFFRGVAATIPISSKWLTHLMMSRNFLDGLIRQSLDSMPYVRSIISGGYHRSSDELNNRKSLNETLLASVLHHQTEKTDFGIVLFQQKFSVPLIPAHNTYNRFQFRGDINRIYSFFFNSRYRNLTWFSEYAKSFPSGGASWTSGVLASLTSDLDVSVLARNYAPDFHSFYASAFSENTKTVNEQGVYLGWKYRKGRKIQLTGYSDFFIFPYIKFRIYKPSEGQEHMIRIARNYSRKNLITFQYRFVQKEMNKSADESSFYETATADRHLVSLQMDYSLGDFISGRTKWMGTQTTGDQKGVAGAMLLQDLFMKYGKFNFSWRYSIFGANDYDARLYAYERDVWLSYSFPSWYGYGERMYVLCHYQAADKLSLWLKWSAVNYSDRTPSVNGLDERPSGFSSDLRVQIRWFF
ncbi:MAG: hypothetical protein ACO3FI_05430 [Cyclobacteriaceae bacterium]